MKIDALIRPVQKSMVMADRRIVAYDRREYGLKSRAVASEVAAPATMRSRREIQTQISNLWIWRRYRTTEVIVALQTVEL